MNRQHVPAIDGLRALAVSAVILFHLNPDWLRGGFAGVDVFFVISGYVVAASLWRNPEPRFWVALRGFFARRLVRLYPALVLCLLLTFLSAAVFIPSSWLSGSIWQTGLLAYLGFGNVAQVLYTDAYFSPRAEFNPFTHMWSLGVEEQFYLLFPLAALFVAGAATVKSEATRRVLLSVLTVSAAGSLLYATWASTAQPAAAYYLLPARWWELSAGVGLAYLHHSGRCLRGPAWAAWLAVSLGLIFIGLGLVFSRSDAFPWPWALLAVVGTSVCIAGLVADGGDKHWLAHMLKWRPVVYVGALSYSLYLWHWPVFVLFRWTWGLETLVLQSLALGVSVAIAAGCHHVVEKPAMHHWQQRGARAGRVLILGWIGVFALMALSAAIVVARPWLNQTRAMKESADWYPQTAVPAFSGPAEAATLWVVGDSHARAMVTALAEVQRLEQLRVRMIWDAGCAVAKPQSLMPAGCSEFLVRALARLQAETRPGDVLLLPGLRTSRLGDQWARFDITQALAREQSPEAAAERSLVQQEARRWFDAVGRLGVRVIVELPKPVLAAPAFRCADWFNRANPVCSTGQTLSKELVRAHTAPTALMLEAAKDGFAFVSLWDAFDLLCPGTECSSYDKDGRPLLFDGDHLTAHANRVMVPSLQEAIRRARTGV